MLNICINNEKIDKCIVHSIDNEKMSGLNYDYGKAYGSNNNYISTDSTYQGYKRKIELMFRKYDDIDCVMQKFYGKNKKIEFSNNSKFFFYYDFLEEVDIRRVKPNFYIISFELYIHPFKYFKENTVEKLTSSGTINNIGNVYCEPRINIYGEGSCKLTIGEQSVVLKSVEEKAVIECEHGKQNVLNKDGELNNSNLEKGEFFEIKSGVNAVVLRGNITRVDIEMRCRNR